MDKFDNQFTIQFHNILCSEKPDFLGKYLSLPILTRLKGVGLLCGTDWINFFKNNFFYSRFDHSIGVALIIWNFTHDKAQTIAGLLHDVSTPAFSHVVDFRKGDALTQTATEKDNRRIISSSPELLKCLYQDGLTLDQVDDYHKYSIADNDVPRLSADRLEYMFPSGAALAGNWSLEKSFTLAEIEEIYKDICICTNEDGNLELGFNTLQIAKDYTNRVIDISFFLQQCEDKMALQFAAEVLNMAVELDILKESDFYNLSEQQIIENLDLVVKTLPLVKVQEAKTKETTIEKLCIYYRTFKNFKTIIRSNEPLDDYYCVNLDVKKRYINPLVITKDKDTQKVFAKRITEVLPEAKKLIEYFLSYKDAEYACVKLI